MHTVQLLTNLVEHHQVWAYLIIFVGLIFEGELILITAGILAHLGALDFGFALVFIYFGGLSKTFLGYYIGQLIHKKWHENKFLKFIEKRVFIMMPNFNQKPFWSIFISKFIMGVNHMVIIFSGYMNIDFKKYLRAEISSTIIWAPLLMVIGYFFSYTALNISREIGKFTLIIILLIIGYIILDKLVGWLYEVFEELYDF
ncbi:MAG: VTT domain-containing protein [Candidatus Paceibacterota bacterium]